VDILEQYMQKAARSLGRSMDYDLVMAKRPPKHLHYTKDGIPDKRYKNHKEAAQWLIDEAKRKSDFMSAREDK